MIGAVISEPGLRVGLAAAQLTLNARCGRVAHWRLMGEDQLRAGLKPDPQGGTRAGGDWFDAYRDRIRDDSTLLAR